MREVYEFLKKCNTYYLATVDGEKPRVRPFGTIDLFEDKLYIQTGRTKTVSRQLFENPSVELCAFDGASWIRIEATAVEENRIEAEAHILDQYPTLKNIYKAGDGNTQVFYLKDATATIFSFDCAPRLIKF